MGEIGIGIVGCGNVSATYLRNVRLFAGLEMRGCADLVPEQAAARAAEHGLQAMTVDELLTAPEIDLVLNLTVPATHFDVTMAALTAGKHVFTEKPLGVTVTEGRQLVSEAEARGLGLGSAPDTFLGAAGRHARRLVDQGAIGRPVVGTAFMMGRGMEHWHPSPSFYYQPGAGPVLDMGPYYLTMLVNLLGPVARVSALSGKGQAERLITAEGPLKGTTFPVGTPTSVLSLLEFASGAMVTFGASWDVFRHGNHPIELHGTEGSLRLPDPDTFGGGVALSARGADWIERDTAGDLFGTANFPVTEPRIANYRMLGVADLVRSLGTGAQPRASGRLALHVLEVLEGILRAGNGDHWVQIDPVPVQPAPLPEEEASALLLPDHRTA